MNYVKKGKDIIVSEISDFNLAQTLECGQCFHFMRSGEEVGTDVSEYALAAFGKGLRVRQEGDTFTFFDTDKDEFEKVWIPYFDLDRDYGMIKNFIVARNPELREIVEKNAGIRLLNQGFFETLLSFIISQNNRIPQIKKVVADISATWGNPVGDDMYSFPEPGELEGVCAADFKEKKTGFRAAYLCDAVSKVLSGEIDGEELKGLELDECEKKLCEVKGVGPKVANCIMLFSLGKREAFPIDVWMKRVLEQVYFGGEEKTKNELAVFAREKYGEYGGYAQQYLFAYAREEL